MRVIDVPALGWEALIVHVDGERVLLLDEGVDIDTRIELLQAAMTEAGAE